MRRPVGMALIGLGAFFLTLGPLVRFYVADKVVVAPLNRYAVTRLEARNATYFDTSTLKTRSGATLLATNTLRGDVRANNGNENVAVWDSTTNVVDTANPDKPIQIQGYRMAFDRRTSELVNCCGVNVDGDNNVRMSGYGLLFPLGHVDKVDYPFFDMTTRQLAPMRYDGEDTVQGMTAYRFVQQIPNTRTSSLDVKIPGRMLGLGKDSPPQKVDRYTQATNTVWVDPRTGIPVRHRQNIYSTVQTPDGRGRMVVAQADLTTIERDQQSLVDLADANALKITAVRGYLPFGALAAGLILLAVGGRLALTAAPGRPAAPLPPRRADGRFKTVPAAPKPTAGATAATTVTAATVAKPSAGDAASGAAPPRGPGEQDPPRRPPAPPGSYAARHR
ncbi:DUF3068 domain-containing protein [Actinomadura sp. NPDC047616]|uniref:DUF3068 domain-containing protein n=1 Tax=Actinomadura sp. NPDC047616 TaxID=3155914 RepID=UPI0033DCDB37